MTGSFRTMMKKHAMRFASCAGEMQAADYTWSLRTLKMKGLLIALVIVALMQIAPCYAQQSHATITGTVTDNTGAVIPGAHVTVMNTSTEVKSPGVTNTDGVYVIPFLDPGPYEITVKANGFQTFLRSGVTLTVDQVLRLDFKLNVGTVRQKVSVTEAAPLLNTTSANVGVTLSQRSIRQLPQADGNAYMLTQLAPGIDYYGTPKQSPLDSQSHVGQIRINGAPGMSQFTLNGMSEDATVGNYLPAKIDPQSTASLQTNSSTNTQPGFIPPKDAVQEFKLQSGLYSAQYGHTAGGNINVVLKSGTNQLHGDIYEWVRNTILFANTFFGDASGAAKAPLHYNRYGGSIGGPVYIPKIYDGRKKTFFFFAYQGFDYSAPSAGFYTVPTLAERKGDFSALTPLGVTIYNPYSATATSNGLIERQPFPNNIIPASYLSTPSAQIAQNMLKWYPKPNQPGNKYGDSNYYGQNINNNTYNTELVRLDEVLSSKDRISFNWYRNLHKATSAAWAGPVLKGIDPSAEFTTLPVDGGGYEQSYTISPSTLLDVKLGIVSWIQDYGSGTQGLVTPASLGFPASTISLFQGGEYLPQITVTGLETMGATTAPHAIHAMTYTFTPMLMKTIGNHNISIGDDYRVYRLANNSQGCTVGCYTFGTTYTNGPFNTSSAENGQGIAAFLLGQPTTGSESVTSSFNWQMLYNAPYIQDDWRVKPNLTLNLGVRYEVETALTERHNQNTRGFDFTSTNPIQAAALAAYQATPPVAGGTIQPLAPGDFHVLGGVTYADSQNRNIYNADLNNIEPRIGVAYSLNGSTVIRGGWGLFMVPHIIIGTNTPGYNQATSLVPSLDSGLTFVANLANPFPSGILPPSGSSLGLKTSLGQGVTVYPVNQRNGLTQEWEFGIQHQFGQNWVADVTYVGNHGYDLATATQLNAIPKGYLSTQPTRDSTVINDLGTKEPNPFEGLAPGSGLNGSTTTLQQLLLPFPQFTSISSNRFDGTSDYNALQLTLKKRFSSGLSLLADYTWAKLLESDILLNPQDTNYARSVSPDDVPMHFNFSGIWQIPVGHGRRFGASWHGPLNEALGGWQGQWIYSLSSGVPLVFANDTYYNGNPATLHTTINGSTVLKGTFPIKNFYPGGVVNPQNSAISLSDHYRTFPYTLPDFREETNDNVDLEVMKSFDLPEAGKNLEFHADFLNAFNHPLFGTPNVSPTSGAFGTDTSQENFPRNIQLGLWLNF